MIALSVIFQILIVCIFGISGVVSIWYSLLILWRGTRSKKWIPIQAEATDFRIHSFTNDGDSSYYRYSVFYSYTIGGIVYLAEGYDSHHFSSRAAAEAAAVAECSRKRRLTVFYYPRNPYIYVLQQGIDGASVLGYSLWGVFYLLIASLPLPWLIGIFLLGMPPEMSCSTPNFSERRWLPSQCLPGI